MLCCFSNSEVKSNQDSKLEFSEDEVTLIARMFSLVGKRFVNDSLGCHLNSYIQLSDIAPKLLYYCLNGNMCYLGGLLLPGGFREEVQRRLRSIGIQGQKRVQVLEVKDHHH